MSNVHTHEKKDTIMELLIIALGIIGTIGCFLSAFPFGVNRLLLGVVLLITCVYFYIAYGSEHKYKLLKIGAILYLLFAIGTFYYWKDGILYLFNVILRIYESNSMFTFRQFSLHGQQHLEVSALLALWILFIPVTLIIIRTIRCKHSYFLAFFASVPFIFAILLFTLRPNTIYFTCLLVFYLMLLGMAVGGHYDTYSTTSAVLKCGVFFGLACFVFMSALRIGKPESLYVRNELVENVRIAVQKVVKDIVQGTQDHSAGELDLATAGNRYYINTNDIKVETETPQSMYLHAYSASLYQGNHWMQPSTEEFNKLYDWKKNGWVEPFQLVRENYKTSLTATAQLVTITNLAADKTYVYVPYHHDDILPYEVVQDAYVVANDEEPSASFHVWSEEQVEQMYPSEAASLYYEKVKNLNLTLPEDLRPLLTSIEIEGIDKNSTQEDIIQAVQNYLRNFGSYTLTPGTTPQEEDFVTYFLTKSKQGYCVHYASAGVLLLRAHGVPARFASGYYISKSAFQNGIGYAQDNNEHAWVEVFDPLYGWKPLEVTPSSSAANDAPILDPDHPDTNYNQGSQNQPNSNTNTTDPNQNTQPQDTINQSQMHSPEIDWSFLPYVCLVLLGCLILPLQRILRLQKWQHDFHHPDPRKGILACGDYLMKWPNLSLDSQIQTILEEAKFSQHAMTQEQQQTLISYCQQVRATHRQTWSKKERFLYRYIKAID